MSSQQRIIKALKDARERLERLERQKHEPIAIVGIGCRFPGAVNSPDTFWQLLEEGVDAMSEIPPERWDIDEYYDPDAEAPGKMYVREGGFVDDIDLFDPQFFRISPREAQTLDPQQRMLLEVVWEALEDAGESADRVRGSDTGFFMGLSWHDYERNAYGMNPERLDAYSAMGNTQSIAVGRLAFALGAHGPTTLLDTACSSSLVSVHAACQSLRSGETHMALAGGVNLMISPLSTIFCCKIKALAPDSRCKTYDAAADGYARGEGCGVVVLKRLSDALADGNHIRAVIRGTAINHDGPSSGLTVPNRGAQQRVIESALKDGGLEPLDVTYIEAHGTGTSLGDPIEIGALGDALGAGRPQDRPLRVGSVKTNIGHLEAAAGIAGLIKAALAVEHGKIPKHLHFKEPSPHIDWEAFPVEVPKSTLPWLPGQRIAGISSFGFSGTNAHVIIEQAPQQDGESAKSDSKPEILCLSARSENALMELAGRYEDFLATAAEKDLAAICHTANSGRALFAHRLAVVGEEAAGLAGGLEKYRAEPSTTAVASGEAKVGARPKIAFLFTGQGSQWVGMGEALYHSQPVFRDALDRCGALLREELQQPLLEVLFGSAEGDADSGEVLLDQTAYTQPALFALEWSLAQLWRSWGIEPGLVMGHSVGEYVAACVAGVFSLEDGLRLIATRGRLMQALPKDGAMVAVRAEPQVVEAAIEAHADQVSLAAINGPRSLVVSGRQTAVERALAALADSGVELKPLAVSHAFHSPLMDPILDEFESVAREISFSAPRLKLVSNVSGGIVSQEVADAGYWRRHIRQPVNFSAGMQALHQAGTEIFLEVGPAPVLLGMGRQCIDDRSLTWLASQRRGGDGREQILKSLAALYTRGVSVDWEGFRGGVRPRRLPLPTYPFQRQRFWVDAEGYGAGQSAAGGTRSGTLHPLVGARLQSAALGRGAVLFESSISKTSPGFLADHRVFNELVPPATAYLEMALAAGRLALGKDVVLNDIVIHQPLYLQDEVATILQTVLEPTEDDRFRFRICSLSSLEPTAESEWSLHVSGALGPAPAQSAEPAANPAELREACDRELAADECYAAFAGQGLDLGSAFQPIRNLWCSDNEVIAEVRLDESQRGLAGQYQLHPALLDALGQSVGAAFPPAEDELFLPVGVERVSLFRGGAAQGWVHGRIRPQGGGDGQVRVADIDLLDAEGQLIARVEGATTRRASRSAMRRSMRLAKGGAGLYERAWKPLPMGEDQTADPETCSWLLLSDGGTAAAGLARKLREAGHQVVNATAGAGFQQLEPTEFVFDPTDAADYERLVEACLSADLQQLQGIIDASHIFPRDDHAASLVAAEALRCGGVLALLRGITNARLEQAPRLYLVTQGTQQVEPRLGSLQLEQSSLWGLGAVISLEHPELRCTRIDLASEPTAGDIDLFGRELLQQTADDQIAYRNGVRYAGRLIEQRLAGGDGFSVAGEGCYLITGGLGALGLAAAEWLVEQGARHMYLVGRSRLGTGAESRIQELRSKGANVHSLQADVALVEDVEALLAQIEATGVPLCGIIHAAGVLDDGALLQLDGERLEKVMAPKVAGAWNLHRCTLGISLDFFVSFSSAASLLGSRGQGNYAAANAYLDGLAYYRRQQGLPGLSVNWGPWAEAGMAAELDERATRRMHDQGWEPIPTREGFVTLGELLAHEVVQSAVLPLEWTAFLTQFPADRTPAFFIELAGAPGATSSGGAAAPEEGISQQLAAAAPEARQQVLMQYLRRRVSAIIGADESELSDPSQPFSALGMDSLLHMELRIAIEGDLKISLPMADFLDSQDLSALTELVAKQWLLSSMAEAGPEDHEEEMEEVVI